MTELRLVSFNLFSGRSLRDGLADPRRAAEAVTRTGADVLATQEVDHCQARSGGVAQGELVASAIGAVDHRFVGLLHGTPGEPGWRPVAAEHFTDDRLADGALAHLDGSASYGIALASRVPVASWHVLHLPRARGRWPIPVPSRPPRVVWVPDEPRAVLAAVLAEPRMTVACTHLSFVPGANVRQLRAARRFLASLPGPRVLLGDLNLPGGLPSRVTGWRSLVAGPTFPSPSPRTQLDHVLADGLPEAAVVGSQVLQLPISDHRAVVVDVVR